MILLMNSIEEKINQICKDYPTKNNNKLMIVLFVVLSFIALAIFIVTILSFLVF
jgi:hypothetical protein